MRAAKQTIKKIVDNEFKMAVAKIKANKQQLTHWCVDANVVMHKHLFAPGQSSSQKGLLRSTKQLHTIWLTNC